jgi:hypothetical protein
MDAGVDRKRCGVDGPVSFNDFAVFVDADEVRDFNHGECHSVGVDPELARSGATSESACQACVPLSRKSSLSTHGVGLNRIPGSKMPSNALVESEFA